MAAMDKVIRLAQRLGCPYVGTIIKGNSEGARFTPPEKNRALFETLQQLGERYGNTGQFDPALLARLARPERFPKVVALAFKLLLKQFANIYWDCQLTQNGAYGRRFARPYAQ